MRIPRINVTFGLVWASFWNDANLFACIFGRNAQGIHTMLDLCFVISDSPRLHLSSDPIEGQWVWMMTKAESGDEENRQMRCSCDENLITKHISIEISAISAWKRAKTCKICTLTLITSWELRCKLYGHSAAPALTKPYLEPFRFVTSGLMNSDQWWVINNLFVYFLVYSAFSLINGSFKTRTQSPFSMWHLLDHRNSLQKFPWRSACAAHACSAHGWSE